MSTTVSQRMTYREACKQAIRAAILADPRVFLMGEDVARYGGCYAVTKGLSEELGEDKIRDTPLSENAYVGAGIGAAIARALVHDPKLVLMDEPFGALDALTREKMNLELLRIWKESQKTIVFVTHGISEAVFLGTRVVVLTAGPARMADNIEIELPHPRTLDMKTNTAFGDYTRRIYKLLGME